MSIKPKFWVGVFFLFCLLFRPPILPIDLLLPLTALSTYGIFREIRYRGFDFKKFYLTRDTIRLVRWLAVVLTLVAIGTTIGVTTLADHSISSSIHSSMRLLWTFALLPINLVFFFMMCQKNRVNTNTILLMLLYATMIQVAIAIISYTVPAIKDVLISIMQANNWEERWSLLNMAEHRMNGFAKSLFDTFGYGMGILTAVPLLLSHRTGNLKYLLCIPFIFLAIVINARTGLLIFGIVIALFSTLTLKGLRRLSSISSANAVYIGLLVAGLALTAYFMLNMSNTNSNLSQRTATDISSYIEFFKTGGSNTGNYGGQADILFSKNFWSLPDTPTQTILGTGMSIYGSDSPYAFSSDVGYINIVWYVGVLGSIILYSSLAFYMIGRPGGAAAWRILGAAVLLSFLVFQVKGNALWSANLGISASLMLIALRNFDNHRERDS